MNEQDRFNYFFRDLEPETKERLHETLKKIENKIREMGYRPW